MKIENLHCHSFDSDLLKSASVAIDCGANHGDFSQWLSENTSAQIYSFEPDPRLFSQLPKLDRVEWIQEAIAGKQGEIQLGLGESLCSSLVYRESENQSTTMVKCNTLENFCRARGIDKIDFLKLDIEGAELEFFEMASPEFLKSIKQITVEFHDFLNKADIPRIQAIAKRMQSLGFYFVCFSQYTWGDCLLINTAYVPVHLSDSIRLNIFYKFFPGIARKVSRLVSRLRFRAGHPKN